MRCADFYSCSRLVSAIVAPDESAVAYVNKALLAPFDGYECELSVSRIAGGRALGSRSVARTARSPVWAPDGARLAAIVGDTASGEATIAVFDTGDWRRLGEVDGLFRPASLAWSPDGRELAFLVFVRGSSNRRSQEPSLAGTAIATDLSMKLDGVGVFGDAGGRRLLVTDPASGAVRDLGVQSRWVDSFCFSPSSELLAVCVAEPEPTSSPYQPGTVRPSSLWVMKRDGTYARRLTDARMGARSPNFTPDGQQIVFVGLENLEAGPLRLFVIPLAGGRPRELAGSLDRSLILGGGDSQHGHPPILAPDGTVYFCARDEGCAHLYRTDVQGKTAEVVAGSPVESISSVSVGGQTGLLCYIASAASGEQRIELLRHPLSARIQVAATEPLPGLIRPEPVAFQARDGQEVRGWLIRGAAAGRTPLLVDVHGGSFSGAWSPVFDPSHLYQQELAANGWTVLLLNARGSDGYGAAFAAAALGAWGQADSGDFHDAIDALVEDGRVDPERLAITGYSYGGFMSNWLTATSGRFAAAVAGGSICNFVSLHGTSDMGWSMCRYDIGVRPDLDPVDTLRRSPVMSAKNVHTPTLLLHGEADLRCPISQAEEWFALLKDNGCRVELVRYAGASHDFLSTGAPRLIVDYGDRLVAWLSEHVTAAPAVRATAMRRVGT